MFYHQQHVHAFNGWGTWPLASISYPISLEFSQPEASKAQPSSSKALPEIARCCFSQLLLPVGRDWMYDAVRAAVAWTRRWRTHIRPLPFFALRHLCLLTRYTSVRTHGPAAVVVAIDAHTRQDSQTPEFGYSRFLPRFRKVHRNFSLPFGKVKAVRWRLRFVSFWSLRLIEQKGEERTWEGVVMATFMW